VVKSPVDAARAPKAGPSPEPFHHAMTPPQDASDLSVPASAPFWARVALKLVGVLPWRARWGLARLVVGWNRRTRRRLEVARINLDIAFGDTRTAAEKDRIARASLINLLGCMLDAIALIPRLSPDTWQRYLKLAPEDIAAIDKLRVEGRGVLVMFSHYGNWELMGAAMACMGLGQCHVVGKRQADWANDLIEHLRTRTGNRIIYKEGAVRATLRALKTGEMVGLSIDQNFSAGIFVPFFGVPAGTPDTLAALARASGAPIVPLACLPNGDGTYTGRLLPPVKATRTDDKDADMVTITRSCLEVLEGIIRERPEFWLWGHKRWKARPPGEEPRLDLYTQGGDLSSAATAP
jgi:KDO2-lipid IV(A) lauroyltransferase